MAEICRILEAARQSGYEFTDCRGYHLARERPLPARLAVVRVDVDFSPGAALQMGKDLAAHGIPASFFLRVGAYSLDDLRGLPDLGFEVGLHCEPLRKKESPPEEVLEADLAALRSFLGCPVVGAASHREPDGPDNLGFWRGHEPEGFGLWYEAYCPRTLGLFQKARYVSDSEWPSWKAYDGGTRRQGDIRSLEEHLASDQRLLYILIHPAFHYEAR